MGLGYLIHWIHPLHPVLEYRSASCTLVHNSHQDSACMYTSSYPGVNCTRAEGTQLVLMTDSCADGTSGHPSVMTPLQV